MKFGKYIFVKILRLVFLVVEKISFIVFGLIYGKNQFPLPDIEDKIIVTPAVEITKHIRSRKIRVISNVPIGQMDELGITLACGSNVASQLGQPPEIPYRKRPQRVKGHDGQLVRSVVAGAMHSTCLTQDYKVLTFGCNDEGALGRLTGEEEDDDKEYLPLSPLMTSRTNITNGDDDVDADVDDGDDDMKIKQVTCGGSHTAMLTQTGHVYITGCFRDGNGRFGRQRADEIILKRPTLLKGAKDVVEIASGYHHLIMLTSSGEVLTSGNAEFGQLGRVSQHFAERGGRRGSNLLMQLLPVRFPRTKAFRGLKVEKVFAGCDSSLLVMSSNIVVGFGKNCGLMLGPPTPVGPHIYQPTIITPLCGKQWAKFSLSDEHLLALDSDGHVYSMGSVLYGKLGVGKDPPTPEQDHPTPQLVKSPTGADFLCRDVAAGSQSSFAVTTQGLLYAWGARETWTGDVDDEGEDEIEYWPSLVEGKQLENRKVLSVSAGSQHLLIKVADDNGTK